ncbi:GatB/YqeY domain-containing protein [Candidatus Roizmanbacteria bacterium]|jgi:hypothetical protein|nr:GatB/YqeY domain-containing protein [Candidatus Roizmanbacteria bacterium]
MIKQKLQQDQLSALKSADKPKLETLRYILAQIKNKEIDKKSDLTDEETVNVLRKTVKELKESIDAFGKGGRADLVQSSQTQLDIISAYLPQEISDEELKKEIGVIIEKNKDLYDKNPKAIMGICVKELKSKADPSRIIKCIQGV